MTAYLVTFSLAVASVGLWTLRVSTTSKGHRVTGSIVSMVEATTYVVAVSHVIGALDAAAHIVLYAGGVGLGTYLGLTLDRTISPTRPTTSVVSAEEAEPSVTTDLPESMRHSLSTFAEVEPASPTTQSSGIRSRVI